jgi:hypothetical protein
LGHLQSFDCIVEFIPNSDVRSSSANLIFVDDTPVIFKGIIKALDCGCCRARIMKVFRADNLNLFGLDIALDSRRYRCVSGFFFTSGCIPDGSTLL